MELLRLQAAVSYNMSMTLQQNATTQQILEAIGRLPTEELLVVAEGASRLRAHRLAPALSEKETTLLEQIASATLSAVERARLHALAARLEVEPLSDDEQDEMRRLVERSEQLNVKRLTAVHELAMLREQPFDKVMAALGLLNSAAA